MSEELCHQCGTEDVYGKTGYCKDCLKYLLPDIYGGA
jgi:hypothetical protein